MSADDGDVRMHADWRSPTHLPAGKSGRASVSRMAGSRQTSGSFYGWGLSDEMRN